METVTVKWELSEDELCGMTDDGDVEILHLCLLHLHQVNREF